MWQKLSITSNFKLLTIEITHIDILFLYKKSSLPNICNKVLY